jgi:transposase
VRYELTDHEWAAIKPMLPNKPGGVPRVNDHRVSQWHFLGIAVWGALAGRSYRSLPAGRRLGQYYERAG